MELNLHQQSQVEVARETLASVDGSQLEDPYRAAYMVGRLEVSLRSLLDIVDGKGGAA
ncbi:hypothetical protein [Streptomyces chartreusis]|uniref:Uncharacterized protein n=1 Tax=Streptomyces chartreusis TaxID=1969 RepID=A0A7H8TEZ3_STRCX|nr:hypothetical protein [Streptomyces chartreusis]QKZ22056.1 hypothetical protein HUT05_34735 [Streptomyces chartreusis]